MGSHRPLLLPSPGGRQISPQSSKRVRRVVPWLLFAAVIVVAVFLLISRIPHYSNARARKNAQLASLEIRDGKVFFGPNWSSFEKGIWEIHLEGTPYEIGYAHGKLADRLIGATYSGVQISSVGEQPSLLNRLTTPWTRFENRRRFLQFPSSVQEEFDGLTDAVGRSTFSLIDRKQNLVLGQIIYDVLADNPVTLPNTQGLMFASIQRGAAVTSRMYVGRTLDVGNVRPFDDRKIVYFVRAIGKIHFVSLAWPGSIGALSGINAESLFVSANSARFDANNQSDTSSALLVREILESCHTLKEAIALLKKSHFQHSRLFLVADGKTNEAAIVEQSANHVEIRRTGNGSDALIATNHALSSGFLTDPENDRVRRYNASENRLKRAEELIRHTYGNALGPKKILEILRDKKAQGGQPLNFGNPNALDSLTATQGVIVDLTQLLLWVGEGPHLLGKFRVFDLRKEFFGEERPPSADLPEDQTYYSLEYRQALEAVETYRRAKNYFLAGQISRALEEAQASVLLDPLYPDPHRLLGDLWMAWKNREAAKIEYLRFLDLHPPWLKEIEAVRSQLSTL